MMRKVMPGLALLVLLILSLGLSGCGKIGGPRFWWDDKTQTRLPTDYELPEDPSAPVNTEQERKTVASGEDLTDENLHEFRTDLDLKEEKRQSEEALFGF